MVGIRGVRRGIYAYDGKCDGTYLHSRDEARVPIGEVAIERGRKIKHVLQPHTRCMSAGARAEWACEHMPCGSLLTGETSAPACFPRQYMRTQKAEGIKYAGDTRCAPGYYVYDGKCDARTNIVVTELVFHPEMSPLNEVA